MRFYEVTTREQVVRLREHELEHVGEPILRVRPIPGPELYNRVVLGEPFGVRLVNAMGDDLEPLRRARMSTNNPTGVDLVKDDRLRNRLWADEHTSPWEANVAVFELDLPLFVKNQIDRHRTVSISDTTIEVIEGYDDFRKFTSRNEFSARYSQMEDVDWVPPLERFRGKASKNKQVSGEQLPEEMQQAALDLVRSQTRLMRASYKQLLGYGVAGELARVVLQMSQGTRISLQASLLNWFKFLKLRLRPDVQEETRLYAEAIADGIKLLWPRCWETFERYTLNAVTLDAEELAMLRERVRAGEESDPRWLQLAEKLGLTKKVHG